MSVTETKPAQRLAGDKGAPNVGSAIGSASARLLAVSKWRWYEYLFWGLAVASFWLFPTKLMLISEIFILGLLALSIDLTLGFAGLVTLGQGAFFGLGAYAAGIMAQ